MTNADRFMIALTAWRENRGGQTPGMQSVVNVICNRAAKRNSSPYAECVRPWQFSSITATHDPQLTNWPSVTDAQYIAALELVEQQAAGTLADLTNGATSYYAASLIPAPAWAKTMTQTVRISGQIFFK